MTSHLYNGARAAALATQWRRTINPLAPAVSRSAICNWVTRGHLEPAGLDDHGHPLYDLRGLARAEKATRDRALRLVGISSQ